MTELDGRNAWGEENDRVEDPRVDRFLVDGVPPAVIGGEPAPEPVTSADPPAYPDPPTAPIPAAGPDQRPRPERRSWLARVLRRDAP
ncbi:hypothetical protein [Actinophytocola xanthii]|uniref:Uncharacterized protein n=1 Tax=Actinophytocola xanthii TaxID=1912961 RepID=A0A1Q8CP27_9PSEU|nr:hypothetical protein [Actinophytocola xanthii]OLF16088.1 hypothetical protein BU204_18200 [Actinophytocola xanthii]